MAYKPQVKQGQGSFGGPSGVARVSFNPDHSKVKLVIKSKEGEEKKYVLDEFPDYLVKGSSKTNNDWYVRLNSDADEILSAYPANGMFVVKVDSFPAPKGEEPAPKLKEASFEGKSYSYQTFTVLLNILQPEMLRGVQIPLTLRYHFEDFEEEIKGKTQKVVAYSHPKSKYTGLLMDFCDAVGLWINGAMPFKPNILPMMRKRIMANGYKFQVVVKDGWIVTIFGMENDKADKDEEDTTFSPTVEDDEDNVPF